MGFLKSFSSHFGEDSGYPWKTQFYAVMQLRSFTLLVGTVLHLNLPRAKFWDKIETLMILGTFSGIYILYFAQKTQFSPFLSRNTSFAYFRTILDLFCIFWSLLSQQQDPNIVIKCELICFKHWTISKIDYWMS